MAKDGYKMIAIGIALTHDDRKKRVAQLNEYIESLMDSIRSASDNDGMPHSQSVGDPVGEKAVKIERVTTERDREQERINAVEWAKEYITGYYDDDIAPTIITAIGCYIAGDKDKALAMVDSTGISQHGFHKSKSAFLRQILKYLRIGK